MNQKIANMIAEYQEDKDFYGRIKDWGVMSRFVEKAVAQYDILTHQIKK